MGYSPWDCKESDTTERLSNNILIRNIPVPITKKKKESLVVYAIWLSVKEKFVSTRKAQSSPPSLLWPLPRPLSTRIARAHLGQWSPILSFVSCVWWGECLALHPLRGAGFGVKHVSHGQGHSGPACCTPPPHTHLSGGASAHLGASASAQSLACEAPRRGLPGSRTGPQCPGVASQLTGTLPAPGDGQVDFEEFVTLLGPKLSTSGIPEKFHGTDFDTVFWKVRPG